MLIQTEDEPAEEICAYSLVVEHETFNLRAGVQFSVGVL